MRRKPIPSVMVEFSISERAFGAAMRWDLEWSLSPLRYCSPLPPRDHYSNRYRLALALALSVDRCLMRARFSAAAEAGSPADRAALELASSSLFELLRPAQAEHFAQSLKRKRARRRRKPPAERDRAPARSGASP